MPDMKKRLFLTTGLISLINALCIIKQNAQADFEDTLVIISFSQDENFVNTNRKIASCHNFSKIYFLKKEKELFSLFDLNNFDCIYSATFSIIYNRLNRYKNLYIFDEGPGSVTTDLTALKNLKGIYSPCFLNKLSIFNVNKNVKRIETDSDVFKKVSKTVVNLLNEDTKPKTSKNVLFIGHYVYRRLSDKKALEFYKKYIDYFINLNYDVYLKTHPRDIDTIVPVLENDYKNNSKFHILKTGLPIEAYDYNFDLVIGSYSGTLVTLAHFRKIPSLQLPMYELYGCNFGLGYKKFFVLYDAYTPKFEEMEDVLSKTKEEIWHRYIKIINKKQKLSDNTELKNIILYKRNILNSLSCLFKKKFLTPPPFTKKENKILCRL